jgi:hypothetical protein
MQAVPKQVLGYGETDRIAAETGISPIAGEDCRDGFVSDEIFLETVSL